MAVVAARLGNLPTGRPTVAAIARAVVQLVVIASVLGLALQHVWSAALFVAMMLCVATFTSAGRVGAPAAWPWIGLSLIAGSAPVLAVIYGTGASPVSPEAVLAISGIIVGGTMTVCSLALRRAFASVREGYGQVEAGLSLGLTRYQALQLLVEPDRPDALVPILDQTRTVGLVTLPGAFIGVLLGGGSTTEAAAAQLVVLVGLLAADTITVVTSTYLVERGKILPADVRERLPAR